VIGIADADTAEDSPQGKNLIIYPVACAVPNLAPGAPKLSGRVAEIRLRPGSFLASFYGKEVTEEEFFCNYEVNPDFEWCALEAGFPVVARGANNEVRAIESPAHRFFVATLFQPQLSSTAERPHPVILAFVKDAGEFARERNVLE
jgi:CTP synthase (UTP-ammonia lyase)